MELKNLLQENHLVKAQELQTAIEDIVKEVGSIPEPLVFVLTEEKDQWFQVPIPDPNMLNSTQGKNLLDRIIQLFIQFLKEKEKVTPYGVGMITEVWYQKIAKKDEELDPKKVEELLNRKASLADVEFENTRNEAVHIYYNTIRGDYNGMLDIIRVGTNFTVGNLEGRVTSKEELDKLSSGYKHKNRFSFF